jgi:phage FluMu gp28-like protein
MASAAATAEEFERLIHFHPYQKRWLADESRFKSGMFARQTGKSFTNSGEIADDIIKHEMEKKKTRWVVLSRGERQAKEFMNENLKPMMGAFWELYTGLKGAPPKIEEGEYWSDTYQINFRSLEIETPFGSRVTALPANPDTARGFSANVLLDEFAFHQNSKAIWGALFPVISKGWKIRVVSTPNGKSNKFYDLMTDNTNTWSKHIVDIYEAVRQGLDRNIDELRAGLGDADLWAQEFELKWLDEATAWLDYDLILANETEGYGYLRAMDYSGGNLESHRVVGIEPGPTNAQVYVGMDIARKKDLTCIWVGEKLGDTIYPREIITMRRAPFAAQLEELARICRRDRPVRVSIDQTGMGEPFVEQAQRLLGTSMIEGVIFTMASKFSMASMLKDRMEDRRFRLPVGDRDLRDDLHSITKAVTSTGSVRLVHDGESDGHGDRFWAAALCCNAASELPALYEYASARAARAGQHDRRRHEDRPDFSRGSRFGQGSW